MADYTHAVDLRGHLEPGAADPALRKVVWAHQVDLVLDCDHNAVPAAPGHLSWLHFLLGLGGLTLFVGALLAPFGVLLCLFGAEAQIGFELAPAL